MRLTSALVHRATASTPWDLGNKVLYDLCHENPTHVETSAVIAKVWLIGRSYAAAIERRRNKNDDNDDFYVQTVAPSIVQSGIDTWIQAAGTFAAPSKDSLSTILATHSQVTTLFSEISGLEKRSLASKYLHFHKPNLFYIYDTRAVESLRKLSNVVGRATRITAGTRSDNEYRKFAQKCLVLQEHIKESFNVALTPREIDKLLLYIHAEET